TARALIAQGFSERDARAEAERRFGNAARIDAECRRYAHERDRNERTAEYRDEWRQDLKFALRQLYKAPVFAAIAIATLALGIGVVLRPLPIPHPERVVTVYPMQTEERRGASAPEYLAMKNVRAFEHVAAIVGGAGVTMQIGDTPEMISADRVSAQYLTLF